MREVCYRATFDAILSTKSMITTLTVANDDNDQERKPMILAEATTFVPSSSSPPSLYVDSGINVGAIVTTTPSLTILGSDQSPDSTNSDKQ
ncbi:unnamed protein product [Onchocerca flexuosa]|uniref:Uncharacterized protein n=1 Tax=Onchocerca flexuosa TaxID=387005 RepID=A0A183HG28_9BILA|nr:unnamed protein product [Onchocerca flexuosa]